MKRDAMYERCMQFLDGYVEILRKRIGADLLSVAVFGSFARRTARFPESDIDVLLVIDGVMSYGEKLKLIRESRKELLEGEKCAKGNLSFPDLQEVILGAEETRGHPPLLLDLTTDSVLLYDKGILKEELETLRKRLAELGAKKVEDGNSWFWMLKPDLRFGEEVEL